jgi:N6-L-threonylcarbamoyladenine synthase
MRILGIESSCDDTAAAVVDDGRVLLASERLSSAMVQRRFGGVVPEVAAREHTMSILPVVEQALVSAETVPAQVDVVAVTQGPGLLGALLIGVTFAKAIAQAWKVPVVGVHHLEAHLYANALTEPIQFPALGLIVSGGHTSLILWEGHGQLRILGATRDDAAGEALDKGARLLGLPYPGGPEIETLARSAPNEPRLRLPVAWLGPDTLDFSFSGLKTATEELTRRAPEMQASIARALEEAVVEALVKNLARAHTRFPVGHVYLAGGVTANQRLQQAVVSWGEGAGVAVHHPPASLCTDNAAMVAAAGFYRYQRGWTMGQDDGPKTPWSLNEVGQEVRLHVDGLR